MPEDPPTEAEERFLALLQDPSRYRKWAERIRAKWERTPEGRKAVERVRREKG